MSSKKVIGKVTSPISYYGGKGQLAPKILEYLPKHTTYVEVFGGGGALLFAKPPSPVEVYNDIDSGLVNFFRVLRDEEKFERFYRKVVLTPYSREEQEFCKNTWNQVEDDVERAYRWFITARMGFSGIFGTSFTPSIDISHRNMSIQTSRWLSVIEYLPQFHQRIMRVQIEHLDFRQIFDVYDRETTCFYCDPPYLHSTRTETNVYQHEMTTEDHKDLINILLNVKGKVVLSGYRNEIYTILEDNGWKRVDFPTVCWAMKRNDGTKDPRVDSIWLSPNCNTKRSIFEVTYDKLP